jgi:hypothetical protein
LPNGWKLLREMQLQHVACSVASRWNGYRKTQINAKRQNAKMTNEVSQHVRLISAAAERMRIHRERRRQGFRCLTFELRETEIDALIRRGLLQAEMRNDTYSVGKALGEHLDHTLGAAS